MLKQSHYFIVGMALMLMLAAPSAFAKHKEGGNPPGWTKGEKTGWDGGQMPPGLSKKEAKKAKKHAKKEKHKAERKAKKKGEEVQGQAGEAAQEAGQAVEKAVNS